MTDTSLQRPTLALTLALAGKRRVSDAAQEDLTEALTLAFDALGQGLEELRGLVGRADNPMGKWLDGSAKARLTLVTGLADGADQAGAKIFLNLEKKLSEQELSLGAVLPCGREDFVEHSPVADIAGFDQLWRRCDFVLELDGRMPPAPGPRDPAAPPNPRADEDRLARADAFVAQSDVLLRNADILIAVDDPHETGRSGGTRETIGKALGVGIPVVLIRLGEPGLAVLRAAGDFGMARNREGDVARDDLRALVQDVGGYTAAQRDDPYTRSLLDEFYHGKAPEPGALIGLWGWFEAWMKKRSERLPDPHTNPREPPPPPPPAPHPRDAASYAAFKERASLLAAWHVGEYRGTFLAGYGLAVIAVFAAVASLFFLVVDRMLRWPDAAGLSILFLFGLVKFAAVYLIGKLAERAKTRQLAHRAADFRYLSERLRAMTFLPQVGWLRAPANWTLPYTTRLYAQGVMDRLFASIVRQARPLDALGGGRDGKVARMDTREAEKTIRLAWIVDQEGYHFRNTRKMAAMGHTLESTNRILNRLVLWIAGVDLILLGIESLLAGGLLPLPPCARSLIHDLFAPALISVAAILPAAVASFNGIRFQSECTRLADRSRQMRSELYRLRISDLSRGDRPRRLVEVMRLAEDATRLTLGEVSEWSAIYGKDFVEM